MSRHKLALSPITNSDPDCSLHILKAEELSSTGQWILAAEAYQMISQVFKRAGANAEDVAKARVRAATYFEFSNLNLDAAKEFNAAAEDLKIDLQNSKVIGELFCRAAHVSKKNALRQSCKKNLMTVKMLPSAATSSGVLYLRLHLSHFNVRFRANNKTRFDIVFQSIRMINASRTNLYR